MARRRDTTDIWKYVFIGYRGKLLDSTSFSDLVGLRDDERLYLSLITDPPLSEGREHEEVLNASQKTGHDFSRIFYFNGQRVIEL